MNVQNRFRQISLASILICFFIPQVQAGIWDDAINKAKSVTEEVIKDTAEGMTNSNDKPPSSPPKASANTASEVQIQAVKNPTSTETSSAVASVQTTPVTETTASQHADVDIIGLELGMTQDQVVKALKAHNKDFDIQFSSNGYYAQFETGSNFLQMINAVASIPGGSSDTVTIEFAAPPSTNIVKRIMRQVYFDKNAKPLKSTIRDALVKKYGTPATSGDRLINGDRLTWIYESSSNSSVNEKKCISKITNGDYKKLSYVCGLILDISFTAIGRHDRLTAGVMGATLADYNEINRQQSASKSYFAQLKEQQNQEKLKKSSKHSAPKL